MRVLWGMLILALIVTLSMPGASNPLSSDGYSEESPRGVNLISTNGRVKENVRHSELFESWKKSADANALFQQGTRN